MVGKEAGAVEATRHEIIARPTVDGKMSSEEVQFAYDESLQFACQARPKMVFISNATEFGTVCTRSELEALAAICKKLGLFPFMEGARLGVVMASHKNDMTFKDIYSLTDVFWIGGIKNGALLGEAVVIKHPSFGADFPRHMKQRGSLLAKGRVIEVQFNALFHDGLFLRLARHVNDAAAAMSSSLVSIGYNLSAETKSNQVFAIFPSALVQELQKQFNVFVWEHLQDGSLVVRLVISWATNLFSR